MAEITQAAYQDLRNYIETNWNYIALNDENDNEVLRLTVTDSRAAWVHNAGASELQLQLVLKGSDAEVSLPLTVQSSAIYKDAQSTTALSQEQFSQFTFEGANDQLTVIHSIQVPQA